jgi:alanine dehydrogenase
MEGNLPGSGKGSPASQYMPQEERLEVAPSKRQLSIGIPREITTEENRVGMVPNGVELLTNHGHRIMVESGAGKAAHFSDHEYSEAGAQIVYDAEEVYKADIILKVAPVREEEFAMIRPRQTLISSVQMASRNEAWFRALMAKKVTALGYEMIRDKTQAFPVLRSMSEIAGRSSVSIATEYLASSSQGRGKMFGGITGIAPSEVVIIGAGTVGEFAARSALGLGCQVRVFDHSVYRLRRLQNNIDTPVYTSTMNLGLLAHSLTTADVVIGAVHSISGKTPCMVPESMIQEMKEGAVVIDVSIDQGGCFETSRSTTHSKPVFSKHGVTHYCVPNIASRVPHTASQALNNIFASILLEICSEGGVEHLIKNNYGVRQGVYLFNGIVTNHSISKLFHLPFQDIDLLMAAFR